MSIILTRNSEFLVIQTLVQLLSENIGIASGNIYYMKPDPIYVNTRSATSGNIEETRYPNIGIIPINTDINYTQNKTVIQQDSYTATGQVKIWTSNIIVEQELTLHTETNTKRDHINYKALIKYFFQLLQNGFTIRGDILPEFSESVNCVFENMTEEIDDAPFCTTVQFKLIYRDYQENYHKLLNNVLLSTSYNSGAITSGFIT